MALINLLPSSPKKSSGSLEKRKKGVPSPAAAARAVKEAKNKIPLSGPILMIIPIFIVLLIFAFAQAQAKQKTLRALEKQVKDLKLGYQKTEELKIQKNQLADALLFLKNEAKNEILWSEKLGLISKAVPPQVWLTNLSIDSKEIKSAPVKIKGAKTQPPKIEIVNTLTIRGSATSLMDAEIIASITKFAETLKDNSEFSRDFQEIKLGPLQSERKNNLTVMNFIIFCRYTGKQ